MSNEWEECKLVKWEMDNVENELHNESMSLQRANPFWLLGDKVIVKKSSSFVREKFLKMQVKKM